MTKRLAAGSISCVASQVDPSIDRRHLSFDEFEEAFAEEMALDERRRSELRKRAANRSRARAIANAELVDGGYARTLEIEPNTSEAGLLARLQSEASTAGRGLWGDC